MTRREAVDWIADIIEAQAAERHTSAYTANVGGVEVLVTEKINGNGVRVEHTVAVRTDRRRVWGPPEPLRLAP
jgi:hypothetical protein